MLDPAVAAGTVPLGIVCGVFAYSFKRRKAACDEVIDDPPRSDYTISTRPQRDWFDPERQRAHTERLYLAGQRRRDPLDRLKANER